MIDPSVVETESILLKPRHKYTPMGISAETLAASRRTPKRPDSELSG